MAKQSAPLAQHAGRGTKKHAGQKERYIKNRTRTPLRRGFTRCPQNKLEKKNKKTVGRGKKKSAKFCPSQPYVFQIWAPSPLPPRPLSHLFSDITVHFDPCFLSRLHFFYPSTGCLFCPVSVFFCPDNRLLILSQHTPICSLARPQSTPEPQSPQ